MEFLDGIPQPLYKYRVWDETNSEHQFQRRILSENEIYLASAEQFNDPFDTTLPFRYDDAELTPENIYLKLLEVGRRRWPSISEGELQSRCFEQQRTGRFENGQYWKEDYEANKIENFNTFGIFSAASKRDNLLMWSHYSNSHKGFCVGFDKFILFDLILGTVTPIDYQRELPIIGLFDDPAQQLMKILRTKSIDWQYEEECRIFKIHATRKVYTFPADAILEITLGCKMSENNKQTITELAKTKFPKAKLFQSTMNLEEFKLDFIPIL